MVSSGCGPVEDSGSIYGWNEVKDAFRVPAHRRTLEQKERVEWAQNVSGQGAEFDPLKEPNVTQMNYEGRWENHLDSYMLASGEGPLRPETMDEDED